MVLCRFDIPAGNYETLTSFYAGVFGWRFEKEGDHSESLTINFGSSGQSGPVTGAVVPRSAPNQSIGCHFLVTSVDETCVKIQEFGGIVFVPKTALPGKGFYACCLDPEENYFLIWEDDENAA